MTERQVPIYLQIRDQMKAKLIAGVYEEGSQIPSERELARKYAVSRMTAKYAVNALVEEGFLYRVQGSGTFVTSRSLSNKVDVGEGAPLGQGLTAAIRYSGKKARDKILSGRRVPSSPGIQKNFMRLRERYFFELKRIRYADDEPISLQCAYLPCSLFPDAERADFTMVSLYDYMQMKGLLPVTFTTKLTFVKVGGAEAGNLDVSEGTMVFLFEYSGYTAKNVMVEFTRSYFRPDLIRFNMITKRRRDEGTVESRIN